MAIDELEIKRETKEKPNFSKAPDKEKEKKNFFVK